MQTPFWHPSRHADRRPFLLARNRVRSALRQWFEAEGFVEVECGALQVSPGNEAHLAAFRTAFEPLGGDARPLYLHTSPEFACKKLLAAGEERIVDFARVYRNGETGPLHSPEFTMVEWYRRGASLEAVMDDTAALVRAALAGTGRDRLVRGEAVCDPALPAERLSVRDAFARHAGIDLDPVLDDRDGLADAAVSAGISVRPDDHWSDLFSRVLVTRIEPALGMGCLTMLCDYPVREAALARPKPDDPRYAERFELYACGVELANGFGELTDPAEQRRRFEHEMDEKARIYGDRYPIDDDFLHALSLMPDACGVAMGFDRLVMLAAGARTIADVQWTPSPAGPQ